MIYKIGGRKCLFILLFSALLYAHSQAREETMNSTFQDFQTNAPVTGSSSPIVIQALSEAATLPQVTPEQVGGSLRPYGNSRRNSRSILLPEGEWGVYWQADLEPTYPATFVHQTGERIVVQELGSWKLFDTKGRIIQRGPRLEGEIVLEPANGVFYIADINSFVAAVNLADGSPSFLVARTIWGRV